MNNRFALKIAALVIAVIAMAAAKVAIAYLRHAIIERQVEFNQSLSHSIASFTTSSLGNIDYVFGLSPSDFHEGQKNWQFVTDDCT